MIDDNLFAALSEFRFRLTQFLRFSEQASRDAGISSLQYVLLLHLRGFGKNASATVGQLAQRLDASHQGAVALVKRCEARGLVSKRRSRRDARCVEIRLAARGRRLVERVAKRHVKELHHLNAVIRLVNSTGKLRR